MKRHVKSLSGWVSAALFALALAAGSFAPVGAWAADDNAGGKWVGNVLFGWTDFFKGWGDEIERRGLLGLVFTGPIMGGANVAVRYTGNVVDIVAVPVAGDNVVDPAVLPLSNPPPLVLK